MYIVWLRRRGHSYNSMAHRVIAFCMGNLMDPEYDGPTLTEEHLPRNYNTQHCYADYRRVMQAYAERLGKDADFIRAELEDQLQLLMGVVMQKAVAGDLEGIRVALSTIQTKARLLGLNLPEKKEISGPEGGRIPISMIHQILEDADRVDDEY